jgi:putative ABC transport system ATP-binding protein
MIARLEQAGKTYPSGDALITALQPTDFSISAGELVLIIGPSGSGKTTLLSLLGCVIYPSSGKVWVNGTYTNDLNDRQMAELRLRNIGFVFQNFNLLAPLTAEQNVMMPLQLMGLSDHESRLRARAALEKLQMGHRLKSLPRSLSGGEQQRVSIARALVTNPSLLLCDEPTAALDAKSVGIVMEELRQLASEQKAVIVVTHDARLRPYASRVIEVENGQAREAQVSDFKHNIY